MNKLKSILQNKWAIIGVVAIIAITLYFFVFRTTKKEAIEIDPEYAEFVSAVTSGVISVESTIKVILVNPCTADSAEREELLEDIFSFSPSVKGRARWADAYTVEFIPSEKLEPATFYEVNFKLSRVANTPSKLKVLTFSFQTIQQDFTLETQQLRTYGSDPAWYYLAGTLLTADVADANNVEKVIMAQYQGKYAHISWNHNADRRTHEFVIDSIERKTETSQLSLIWNGSEVGVDRSDNQSIEIPALGTFKVLDAVLYNNTEQYFVVYFSDPINAEQNLDGIITIDNIDVKLLTDGNTVKVYPSKIVVGEYHTLTVSDAIENYDNQKLPESFTKEFGFSDIKPAVELVGNGIIMPMADSVIFPFKVVNLKAVDVIITKVYKNNIGQFLQNDNIDYQWGLGSVARPIIRKRIDLQNSGVGSLGKWHLFSIDLSKLIKIDKAAIYNVRISFRKEYSLFRCNEKETIADNEISLNTASENIEDDDDNIGRNYRGDNNDEEYDYNEDYWENRDNPCHVAYYNSDRFKSRNVFASNIGIVAKSNVHNDISVIVTNITSAQPISGADVEFFDYQHQSLGKITTNGDGFADIHCRHKISLIVVNKNDDFGYLSIKEGQSLSLSMFDVSGQELKKGFKGFIYGERGVWRPGDSIFITFILEDKNKQFPKGQPVVFDLKDPRGQLFKRAVKIQHLNGFYTFATATPNEAPTGNWLLTVKAGGVEFYKTLKIETIKPNRLAIDMDLGKDSVLRFNVKGNIAARWLHGAIASGLKTTVDFKLMASQTSFAKFPGYNFNNPVSSFTTEEKNIFEGSLNAEGKTQFNAPIAIDNAAPGMLRLGVITKVFEEGGNFSIDYYTTRYSPFNYYVGLSMAETQGFNEWLYTGKTQKFKIATVDYLGKPASLGKIKAEIVKLEWNWWYDRSDEQLATYVNSEYSKTIFEKLITTNNGFGDFQYTFPNDAYGAYYIRITDTDGGHVCGQKVFIYSPWSWDNENNGHPEMAAMLVVTTDKEKYNIGDKVQISIPATEQTKALISIESGSRIIQKFWSEAKPNANKTAVIEFEATAEMAPNAFVNVMLLQPYKNTANDMPLRLYGYAPILVEDPATRVEPILEVPEKVGSEETMNIKVSEKNGHALTYSIAIVDEGLLSISRYKTPNPWDNFYTREALGINTWDIYNYIFGGAAGKIEHLFAIGGDGYVMNDKGNKNSNRFTPVVKYMGPFELKKGASNKHSYKLPQYSGAVRTMLVAGMDAAYGVTEKTTIVKNPLMVVATLPRVLGPGEEVLLPVTVFADEADIKTVNVEVQGNQLLSFASDNKQTLTFTKPSNKDAFFKLRVKETTGQAHVKILVTSGKYKATYEINLAVRNANERQYKSDEAVVEASKSWQKQIEWFGTGGTNKAVLEISTCPPIDLGRRLQYLITYPHGCIEQTISSLFPQLYLNQLVDLNTDEKLKVENNIKAGIDRLKLFQNSDGAFTYWPGCSYVNKWACNYAGHFIVEAEKMGYSLPEGMKKNWIRYQQNHTRGWETTEGSNASLTQAYRLTSLALAGTFDLSALNQLRETANLPTQTKWMLAWAYALAGQKETAQNLIKGIETDYTTYRETGNTYGSAERDLALVIPTLCALTDYEKAWPIAEKLAKILSSQKWLSTQETAIGLMAMSQFINGTNKYNNTANCQLTINGKTESVKIRQKIIRRELMPEQLLDRRLAVVNNGSGNLYVRLTTEGVPLAGNEVEVEQNLKLNIEYTDNKGNTLDVTKIKQGLDFNAEVTISNPGLYLGDMQNLVLSQVFPSGWEIINNRVADINNATENTKADYENIRDDRVYTYFGLTANSKATFIVKLNASYAGRFYLPAIHTEAMYDNNVSAVKKGMWVEVVR